MRMKSTAGHPQAGFTLVESLVSMAIAAIALGTAIPSFKDTTARRVVEGHAQQLATDLQYARSESVARNEPLHFSIHATAAGTCYVIHTGDATDCRCDGDVDGAHAACAAGSQSVKAVLIPATAATLQSNVASMLFDPVRGTVTPTATLKLSDGQGHAVNHVVNVLGRVRSCAPNGASWWGYKSC